MNTQIKPGNMKLLIFFFVTVFLFSCRNTTPQLVTLGVDYESFLAQHDMLWDEIPHRWEVSPYSGIGNVGFLFYRTESEGKNVMSIYTGRHDYFDHREAPKESWETFSLPDIKTMNHNTLLLKRFIDVFGISLSSIKNQTYIKELIFYGTMVA